MCGVDNVQRLGRYEYLWRDCARVPIILVVVGSGFLIGTSRNSAICFSWADVKMTFPLPQMVWGKSPLAAPSLSQASEHRRRAAASAGSKNSSFMKSLCPSVLALPRTGHHPRWWIPSWMDHGRFPDRQHDQVGLVSVWQSCLRLEGRGNRCVWTSECRGSDGWRLSRLVSEVSSFSQLSG